LGNNDIKFQVHNYQVLEALTTLKLWEHLNKNSRGILVEVKTEMNREKNYFIVNERNYQHCYCLGFSA